MGHSETKQEIISAAETLFSDNGVSGVKISDIAKKAGVTDSVIYHYFDNKEDLLFSSIGRHLQSVLDNLNKQLEGILEPFSRLSKMIWFHLDNNKTHTALRRLLIFECRSNPNFYVHSAHKLIRQYVEIMMSILKDGVEKGEFDEKINIKIARDIILGYLDVEDIRYLITPEKNYQPPDLYEFMSTVKAMIEKKHDNKTSDNDKKLRIIRGAEAIFSENGYSKSTISQIAQHAKVAEGTVYEYFKNKEDLLLTIPEYRFREHIESNKELFQVKDAARKMRRFIRHNFLLCLQNTNFLKTFLFHISLNPKFYESEGNSTYKAYLDPLDRILDEGKKEGIFRQDLNNQIFLRLRSGGFRHITLRWMVLEKKVFYDKMLEIEDFVTLMTRAAIMN